MSPVTPTYVFAHGFLGFERLGPAGLGLDYWRGLPAMLHRLGVRHLFATVPPGRSLAARAEALDRFLQRHDASEVVLIGHSMGGLDGRYLVHHLDQGGRVRCLITIATPHQGSALAPWALQGRWPLPRVVRAIGRAALQDLTPAACRQRNATLTDRPGVRYLSVIAARPRAELAAPLRWLLPRVMDAEGPHDGMVSLASARWGEVVAEVAADHFELIGWDLAVPGRGARRQPFDHLALYECLLGLGRGALTTGRDGSPGSGQTGAAAP